MDLHSRIAAWRKAKGWSQGQLAKAIGVTTAAVSFWEGAGAEPTAPSRKNLDKLVAVLGITIAEFYGDIPKAKSAAKKPSKAKRAAA